MSIAWVETVIKYHMMVPDLEWSVLKFLLEKEAGV
jgi:hypothetical protein